MNRILVHACIVALLCTILVVPSVTANGYNLTLSTSSGPSGTVIIVTGSGFPGYTMGFVWLDINNNSLRDVAEPWGYAISNSTGYIPNIAGTTTLTIPGLAPGEYPVRADFPIGGSVEASTGFTVTRGIVLSPAFGSADTVITVTGGGFNPDTAGSIWYDTYNDGVLDADEPSVAVTSTSTGTIPEGITLTVAGGDAGNHFVRADIPADGSVEASAPFTVTGTITLNPASGQSGTNVYVNGTGFTPSASFIYWIDTNANGVWDGTAVSPIESQKTGTTTAGGAIPASSSITIMQVAEGGYTISFDLNKDGTIDASAPFAVVPALKITQPSGAPGSTIGIQGLGFTANATGTVWFDSNGNGLLDAGEPQSAATASALGSLPAPLPTPLVAPDLPTGTYQIYADVPAGGAVETSAGYTVRGILLEPALGAPGSIINITGYGFPTNRTGYIWFDTDGDTVKDEGEPSVNAASDEDGTLVVSDVLTVPETAAGDYFVRADIPSGGFAVDASATFTVEYGEGPCGDVNNDGKLTMGDGRLIYLNVIYGDTEYPLANPWAADVNGDGKITMGDGRLVYLNVIYGAGEYPLECGS